MSLFDISTTLDSHNISPFHTKLTQNWSQNLSTFHPNLISFSTKGNSKIDLRFTQNTQNWPQNMSPFSLTCWSDLCKLKIWVDILPCKWRDTGSPPVWFQTRWTSCLRVPTEDRFSIWLWHNTFRHVAVLPRGTVPERKKLYALRLTRKKMKGEKRGENVGQHLTIQM